MSTLGIRKWSEKPIFFTGSKEVKFPILYEKAKKLECNNLISLLNNNDEKFILKRIMDIEELELKELGIEELSELVEIITTGNYFLKLIEKDLSKRYHIAGFIQ